MMKLKQHEAEGPEHKTMMSNDGRGVGWGNGSGFGWETGKGGDSAWERDGYGQPDGKSSGCGSGVGFCSKRGYGIAKPG